MLESKLIVVLSILGGVLSYDVDCSIDVEQKCGKIENNWTGVTWPEDQEQLKKACNIGSILDCQIDFAENCPKSLLRAFLGYLIETKGVYQQLCGNNAVFKQKYLENVKCLNKHTTDLFSTCRQITKGNTADLCGNTVAIRRCVVQGVSEKCGEKAREVFDVLSQPMLTIEKIFCKKGLEDNFIFF